MIEEALVELILRNPGQTNDHIVHQWNRPITKQELWFTRLEVARRYGVANGQGKALLRTTQIVYEQEPGKSVIKEAETDQIAVLRELQRLAARVGGVERLKKLVQKL